MESRNRVAAANQRLIGLGAAWIISKGGVEVFIRGQEGQGGGGEEAKQRGEARLEQRSLWLSIVESSTTSSLYLRSSISYPLVSSSYGTATSASPLLVHKSHRTVTIRRSFGQTHRPPPSFLTHSSYSPDNLLMHR